MNFDAQRSLLLQLVEDGNATKVRSTSCWLCPRQLLLQLFEVSSGEQTQVMTFEGGYLGIVGCRPLLPTYQHTMYVQVALVPCLGNIRLDDQRGSRPVIIAIAVPLIHLPPLQSSRPSRDIH
jgi:hypothetical protein